MFVAFRLTLNGDDLTAADLSSWYRSHELRVGLFEPLIGFWLRFGLWVTDLPGDVRTFVARIRGGACPPLVRALAAPGQGEAAPGLVVSTTEYGGLRLEPPIEIDIGSSDNLSQLRSLLQAVHRDTVTGGRDDRRCLTERLGVIVRHSRCLYLADPYFFREPQRSARRDLATFISGSSCAELNILAWIPAGMVGPRLEAHVDFVKHESSSLVERGDHAPEVNVVLVDEAIWRGILPHNRLMIASTRPVAGLVGQYVSALRSVDGSARPEKRGKRLRSVAAEFVRRDANSNTSAWAFVLPHGVSEFHSKNRDVIGWAATSCESALSRIVALAAGRTWSNIGF